MKIRVYNVRIELDKGRCLVDFIAEETSDYFSNPEIYDKPIIDKAANRLLLTDFTVSNGRLITDSLSTGEGFVKGTVIFDLKEGAQ